MSTQMTTSTSALDSIAPELRARAMELLNYYRAKPEFVELIWSDQLRWFPVAEWHHALSAFKKHNHKYFYQPGDKE